MNIKNIALAIAAVVCTSVFANTHTIKYIEYFAYGTSDMVTSRDIHFYQEDVLNIALPIVESLDKSNKHELAISEQTSAELLHAIHARNRTTPMSSIPSNSVVKACALDIDGKYYIVMFDGKFNRYAIKHDEDESIKKAVIVHEVLSRLSKEVNND